MLFKRFNYLVFGSLLLLGCADEDQREPKLNDPISSIKEVSALITETRFVIELPNGQVVDFVPRERFVNQHSINYTSTSSGFNYARLSNPIVVNGATGNSATF